MSRQAARDGVATNRRSGERIAGLQRLGVPPAWTAVQSVKRQGALELMREAADDD
jgi:hypothetical protein